MNSTTTPFCSTESVLFPQRKLVASFPDHLLAEADTPQASTFFFTMQFLPRPKSSVWVEGCLSPPNCNFGGGWHLHTAHCRTVLSLPQQDIRRWKPPLAVWWGISKRPIDCSCLVAIGAVIQTRASA